MEINEFMNKVYELVEEANKELPSGIKKLYFDAAPIIAWEIQLENDYDEGNDHREHWAAKYPIVASCFLQEKITGHSKDYHIIPAAPQSYAIYCCDVQYAICISGLVSMDEVALYSLEEFLDFFKGDLKRMIEYEIKKYNKKQG